MRLTIIVLTTLFALGLTGIATATTNRVANGDFETAGATPSDIPGWSRLTGTATRGNLGVNAGGGLILQGPASVRSADLIAVTGGETLNLSFDVQERGDRNDADPRARGDSVLAVEFVDAAGHSMSQLEYHCDAYFDYLDNNIRDASSTCTSTTGYMHVKSGATTLACVLSNKECLKYAMPIVVPAGATFARILLGGSLAADQIDPITGAGIVSPTSLTTFDNVVLGN
ncbi:MAG TPA: hypothetical protein VM370_10900 [Candidatus Thermoplasmatota archaeon]|nr:hypothetical protein [Candidatus Thermoplasmatota archaeon]